MKKKLKQPAVPALAVPGAKEVKKSNTSSGNGSTNGNGKTHVITPAIPIGELDARELISVLLAVRQGDFSVRMPVDKDGLNGKICDILNEIISMNEALVD